MDRKFRDVYVVPSYVDAHGVSGSYRGVFVGKSFSLADAKLNARNHGYVVMTKGGEHGLAPASAFDSRASHDAPMVYAVTVYAHRRAKKVGNPSRKRKATKKRIATASYTVSIFDPEAGSFIRFSRMKGTSARDVERRVMAKWNLDADDVKVTKSATKKRR